MTGKRLTMSTVLDTPAQKTPRKTVVTLAATALMVACLMAAMAALVVAGAASELKPGEKVKRDFGTYQNRIQVNHEGGDTAARDYVLNDVSKVAQRDVVMYASGTAASGDIIPGRLEFNVLWSPNLQSLEGKVDLISGRWPQQPGEVLLAEHIAATYTQLPGEVAVTGHGGQGSSWTVVGVGKAHLAEFPTDVMAMAGPYFMSSNATGTERYFVAGKRMSADEQIRVEEDGPGMSVTTAGRETTLGWLLSRTALATLVGFSAAAILALVAACGFGVALTTRRSRRTHDDITHLDPAAATATRRHTLPTEDKTFLAQSACVCAAIAGACSLVSGLGAGLLAQPAGAHILLVGLAIVVATLAAAATPIFAAAIILGLSAVSSSSHQKHPSDKHGASSFPTATSFLAFAAAVTTVAAAVVLCLGWDAEAAFRGQLVWDYGPYYDLQLAAAAGAYLVCFLLFYKTVGPTIACLACPVGAGLGWLVSTAPNFGDGWGFVGMFLMYLGTTLVSLFLVAPAAVFAYVRLPRRISKPQPAA